MKKTIYYYILHVLAGVLLGYILFSCKSSKSGCDAYSSNFEKKDTTYILNNISK